MRPARKQPLKIGWQHAANSIREVISRYRLGLHNARIITSRVCATMKRQSPMSMSSNGGKKNKKTHNAKTINSAIKKCIPRDD